MTIATTFNYYSEELLPYLSVFKWPKIVTSLLDDLDITDSISFFNYTLFL